MNKENIMSYLESLHSMFRMYLLHVCNVKESQLKLASRGLKEITLKEGTNGVAATITVSINYGGIDHAWSVNINDDLSTNLFMPGKIGKEFESYIINSVIAGIDLTDKPITNIVFLPKRKRLMVNLDDGSELLEDVSSLL